MVLIVLLGAGALAYLGDYFDGNGEWIVLSEKEITLVGTDGQRLSVQMTRAPLSDNGKAVEDWLVSEGFVLVAGTKDTPIKSYSKKTGMTFEVSVRIEPQEATRCPSVSIEYTGHGFKRLFDGHIKEVEVLANRLVKECTVMVTSM